MTSSDYKEDNEVDYANVGFGQKEEEQSRYQICNQRIQRLPIRMCTALTYNMYGNNIYNQFLKITSRITILN